MWIDQTILATFDLRGRKFCIPTEWAQPCPDSTDMAGICLEELCLQAGDTFELLYELGTTQIVHLQLTAIEPMKKGMGTHYPYALTGAGRGVLDTRSADEPSEYISQIDRFGQTSD